MRKITAVGSIRDIWLVTEEAMEEELPFKESFLKRFGKPWQEIMLEAELPFVFHSYWQCLVAVTNLHFEEQGTLKSLLDRADIDTVNIIIG